MQTASHTVRGQHSWEGSSIEGHTRPLPELVGPCAIEQFASPFLSNATSEDLQVSPSAQPILTHTLACIPQASVCTATIYGCILAYQRPEAGTAQVSMDLLTAGGIMAGP